MLKSPALCFGEVYTLLQRLLGGDHVYRTTVQELPFKKGETTDLDIVGLRPY